MSIHPAFRTCAAIGPLAALLLLAGCYTADRNAFGVETRVGPLPEQAFDHYANRLASFIRTVVTRRGYRRPAQIAEPLLGRTGLETSADAVTFAKRLAGGVSDRLGGLAWFVPPSQDPPLVSTIEFYGRPGQPGTRLITFRLIERATSEELLNESLVYRLPDPHSPARSAADISFESASPALTATDYELGSDSQPLAVTPRIDALAGELTRYVRTMRQDLRSQLLASENGEIVLLDSLATEAVEVVSQVGVLAPPNDSLLRVEAELRAAAGPVDVAVRALFIDLAGHPVEASPAVPYRLTPDFAKTVVFRPVTGEARRYVLLISGE